MVGARDLSFGGCGTAPIGWQRPADPGRPDVSGQQLPLRSLLPPFRDRVTYRSHVHLSVYRACAFSAESCVCILSTRRIREASLKTQTGAFPTLVNTSARRASLCATTVPATISPVFAPFRVRRRIRPDMYQPELCPPGSSCTLLPDRQHRASLFLSSLLLWLL